MGLSPGWDFDPAERDRERIAAYGAPLFVIASPAPPLRGWSWELHDGAPIFGEAAYVDARGRHSRVRSWKSLPEGRHRAIAAHQADLMNNAAADVAQVSESETVSLVVDATPRVASAMAFGRYRFIVCEVEATLLTLAFPIDEHPPALEQLAP